MERKVTYSNEENLLTDTGAEYNMGEYQGEHYENIPPQQQQLIMISDQQHA